MDNINIRIYFKFFDFYLLDILIYKIKDICLDLNVLYSGPIRLPCKRERFNLLRSPHVNKKSRDQLEICTYKRIMDFFFIDNKFLEIIENIFFYSKVDFNFKIFL